MSKAERLASAKPLYDPHLNFGTKVNDVDMFKKIDIPGDVHYKELLSRDLSFLNEKESVSFKKFKKKLPGASKIEVLYNSKNKIFRGEVKGKVPGSKAVYEKTITLEGETIKFQKTTYAPDGSLVHVKIK